MRSAASATDLFEPTGLLHVSRLRACPAELATDLLMPVEVRHNLWVLGSAHHISELAESRAAGTMRRTLWPGNPAPGEPGSTGPPGSPPVDPLLGKLRPEHRRAAHRLSRDLSRRGTTPWHWMASSMSPRTARGCLDGIAENADVARRQLSDASVCAAADLVRPTALSVCHRLLGIEGPASPDLISGAAAFVDYSSNVDELETARETGGPGVRGGRARWPSTGSAAAEPGPTGLIAPNPTHPRRPAAKIRCCSSLRSCCCSAHRSGTASPSPVASYSTTPHGNCSTTDPNRRSKICRRRRSTRSTVPCGRPVPSPVFTLRTRANVQVGGAHIPKGSMVLCVVATANLDPEDASASSTGDTTNGTPATDLTFGVGRFRCPGATLSRMTLAAILAAYLRDDGHRRWKPGTIAWQEGVMANPTRIAMDRIPDRDE
jgi:hypothetical protein